MGRSDPGEFPSLKNPFDEWSKSEEGQAYWAEKTEWLERPLYEKGEGEAHAADPSDLVQGQHVDCFLMAATAAVVQQHPHPDDWMKNVIKDNGDGSYTVTFWDLKSYAMPNPMTGEMMPAQYTPREVTVSGELHAAARSDDGGEKWPAIIEKAYADAYGGTGKDPFTTRDHLGDAMEHLTGLPTTRVDPTTLTIDQLDRYISDHYAITVQAFDKPLTGLPHEPAAANPNYAPGGLSDFNPQPAPPLLGGPHYNANDELKPWHEYYVHKVDKEAGLVVINNVWDNGREDIRIPFDQFKTSFETVKVNPVYVRDAAP